MTVEALIAFLAATYLHAAGVPLSGVALVAIGLATLLLLLLIRTQRRLRALRADLGIDLAPEAWDEALRATAPAFLEALERQDAR